MRACPAQAIRLEPGTAGGLPFIVPREQPCVVCTDLSCMKVCPTGALKMVSAVSEISMGIAVVDHARCLRGPFDDELSDPADRPQVTGHGFHGEDCRLCVTSCPVGESAMAIDAGGKVAILAGCIGCGVCYASCDVVAWRPDYLGNVQSGKAQVFLLGWTGDFGDPANFLNVHFGSKTDQFGFDNPKLFDLLTRADSETNIAKRTALYQQASIDVMKFLPVVPYVHSKPALAFQKNVQGYVASPVSLESFATVSYGS